MESSAVTAPRKLSRRPSKKGSSLKIGGTFYFECYDKDGNLKWTDTAKNIVPNAALTAFLDILYRNQTPAATLYMGLVDNSGFTAFAAGDTVASSGHTGWTEVVPGTGYTTTGTNRLTWTPAAAASQAISNSSTVNFPMLATYTVKGAFLTNLQSGTGSSPTNYIAAEAAFSGGTQAVNNGDTLKVTYTVNASTS
jgi:hypothetical protein